MSVALLAGVLALAPAHARATIDAATGRDAAVARTLLGVRAPGVYDPYDLPSLTAWQGKTNAVAVTFRKTSFPVPDLIAKLASIWDAGSVPILTIEPLRSNARIAAGETDAQIDAWAGAIKQWLSGADHAYGTADDRRVYIRLAHEANGSWYSWSPCSRTGGTTADYRAMWRRYHDRFAMTGVESTRLAWIFSVNQTDSSSACRPEELYPGHAYVDWLGFDGYSRSKGKTVAQELAPMASRLRAIAPKKPLSINEAGASALVVGDKAAWIADYFTWVHANDVRMLVYFNSDLVSPWSVFGGGDGDEVFTYDGRKYNAWSVYRSNVAAPWVVGADRANPRRITDAQFLGR